MIYARVLARQDNIFWDVLKISNRRYLLRIKEENDSSIDVWFDKADLEIRTQDELDKESDPTDDILHWMMSNSN